MSFLEVTAQLANGFLTTLLIFGVTLVELSRSDC